MTKISTIYNRVDSLLSETFTQANGYLKMNYPYDIDQNDRFILNQGYGFYLSGGVNTENYFSGNVVSQERNLVVILSRIDRGTDIDTDLRQNAEKLLFEDQLTLISAMHTDDLLIQNVSYMTLSNDNGIEFAFDEQERSNYLFLQTAFNFEYIENI